MGEHTVASFDEDLEQISQLIRDMGDLARSMVGGSTRALLNSDNALAQRWFPTTPSWMHASASWTIVPSR